MNAKDFIKAAEEGNLQELNRLISLNPSNAQEMVCSQDFEAFRVVSFRGHLAMMERLMALVPNKVQEMVCAQDFEAFIGAAANGHLAMMEKLMELVPDKVQEMVCAQDFTAFIGAAANGHLAVMERLMALVPDKVQEMVQESSFEISFALRRGRFDVVERLLRSPSVFAYAEMHVRECGNYVRGFMNRRLTDLAEDIDAFHATHPNDVFDITDVEQAKFIW